MSLVCCAVPDRLCCSLYTPVSTSNGPLERMPDARHLDTSRLVAVHDNFRFPPIVNRMVDGDCNTRPIVRTVDAQTGQNLEAGIHIKSGVVERAMEAD
jgi:hypothetical protein